MTTLALTLDPGLVYLVVGSIISIQTAVAGWILYELIELKGRMHRLEARETFIDANIAKLENHMNEIIDDLLPHRRNK